MGYVSTPHPKGIRIPHARTSQVQNQGCAAAAPTAHAARQARAIGVPGAKIDLVGIAALDGGASSSLT